MLPNTATRVQAKTAEPINVEIDHVTAGSFARRAVARPEDIDDGIRQLEQEWDIERTLQANFAIVNLIGIALGAFVDRRWYLFSAAATGFMVQHALQGWCPPVPIFRRLKYRTASEINHERFALKALRGDFDDIGTSGSQGNPNRGQQALRAAQRA
ncbi:hypothetical protein ACFOYU_06015 [Microvirga sp. GCM10011540]|uniref:hypothetical protein n=1 Tax=Microvirga sp. GCM10011540 TaxID=3317338 RepID=UPI00361D860E